MGQQHCRRPLPDLGFPDVLFRQGDGNRVMAGAAELYLHADQTALGSSPSSMLWSSDSYAPDTHHLASLMTQDRLQVLLHLVPLNLCQHRRDGTQPCERRFSLDGLVEIKFQVTNCRQPWFTHRPSRIASEIPSSSEGLPTALSPPECSGCGSKLTYLMGQRL